MIRFRTLILLAATGLIAAATTPGQEPASKAYLLHAGKGETFTDIGSDDKTMPERIDEFKDLGGKAIKINYNDADNATAFETRNVLYTAGPERLIIGSALDAEHGAKPDVEPVGEHDQPRRNLLAVRQRDLLPLVAVGNA